MLHKHGNIWDHHADNHWIVITTNIGWKQDGTNPMGAGLALDAMRLYPELPSWYGSKCQTFKEEITVLPYIPGRLILFPTKKLNPKQPWLSWRADSDLNLIKASIVRLKILVDLIVEPHAIQLPIGIPLVGCKNGNLDRNIVLPILKTLDDRFMLIESPR